MKVNIFSIVNHVGASLAVDFNEVLEELNKVDESFVFNNPVKFSGQLVNVGGVLKLDGNLTTDYVVKCSRCLKDIRSTVDLDIAEDFVNAEKNDDTESYTYEGNFIVIDKVLIDNIILNLPVRQVCDKECKGLCPVCGTNLNEKQCDCKEDAVNPRMEVLKNFFNN